MLSTLDPTSSKEHSTRATGIRLKGGEANCASLDAPSRVSSL